MQECLNKLNFITITNSFEIEYNISVVMNQTKQLFIAAFSVVIEVIIKLEKWDNKDVFLMKLMKETRILLMQWLFVYL